MALHLDPQICRNVAAAMGREWLVTNGLGGYASGTVAGVNTRRYHGLLVASLNPHVQRMVLLAALEEWLLPPDGRIIEKRIWMESGVSRTVLTYRLLAGPPLSLQLRPLFAHRDYHEQRHGQGGFDMAESSDGWIIDAAGVRSHFDVRPSPVVRSRPDWYWRVLHRAERDRGLDDEEDLFTPGT